MRVFTKICIRQCSKLTLSHLIQTSSFVRIDTVLSSEESVSMEGQLTKTECFNAMKDIDPGKSPGTDGLLSVFYKVFWSDFFEPVLKSLNYGFENG